MRFLYRTDSSENVLILIVCPCRTHVPSTVNTFAGDKVTSLPKRWIHVSNSLQHDSPNGPSRCDASRARGTLCVGADQLCSTVGTVCRGLVKNIVII